MLQQQEIFLKRVHTSSEAHQPPIQWVLGTLPWDMKLTTHLHLVPRLKLWTYTPMPPVCFHDMHRNIFTLTCSIMCHNLQDDISYFSLFFRYVIMNCVTCWRFISLVTSCDCFMLILNGGSSRMGEGRKWSRLIMRYCSF